MDKYIGRLLDNRYEILEVIGTGGMAVVYKARCHRLNRLVAIKILKNDYLEDEDFRRRFHAESQAVAMLSHPNIVSVYDVSTSISLEADYIVMELIEGITLKQYMQTKGYLNWKETLHFGIQIAKALEHAHSRGIVHRDIKPHNVMVLKNGSVKVADFGIAQVTSSTSTLTTEALGSVHYISPEQAKGGRVDNRSDIYSLGVVMYEMIAGRVPYDGDSPVNIAIQHINGGAQKPSQYNPNIPMGLEQIIGKAMALSPKDRYLTATAMLYDMDEFRKTPTMVFAHQTEQVTGDTQVIPTDRVQEQAEKQTIAQRKAGQTVKAPVPDQDKGSKRAEPDEEEEEGRSRVTTIAIASCVVVGIVAIVIFCVLWAQGVLFDQPEKVSVPQLIGQNYSTLRDYPGIVVVSQGEEYNSEYAKGEIIYQYPHAGDKVNAGTKVFVKLSKGPAPKLERLTGLKLEEAQRRIDALEMGLKIAVREENHATVSAGTVLRTEPGEGASLTTGQTITLWVSKGPKTVYQEMISVVGLSYDNAVTVLNVTGFDNVIPNYVNSDRPEGEVVGQNVAQYENVDVKTQIVLDVSNGIAEEPQEPDEPQDPQPSEPSQPSQPEEPTPPEEDPPADEPTEEPVTLEYVFLVPNRTEGYSLSIKAGDSWLVEDMAVGPDTATVAMTLTGNGIQSYDLYIDGEFYATETVDFEPDD